MSSNNIHLISVLSDKLKELEMQCIVIKAQIFDLGVTEQKRRDENEAALYGEVKKVIDEVLVRDLQKLKLAQRG